MSAEITAEPARRRTKRWLGALITTAVAVAMVIATPLAANAAVGDYTVDLSAPATVDLGQTYNYVATLDFDGVDSTHPATGVQLTTTLPEGTAFLSVPSGPDTPVASFSYDPATRVLALVLNDTTQSVLSIVYTVGQTDDAEKYEDFPLATSMTGSGGPSGPVQSQSVTTSVEGDNDYTAGKGSTTVVGSDNRTVTYYFNVGTSHPTTASTFTSYSQTLTDTLPAGAVLVASSPTWNSGSWDTSAWPSVAWTRNAEYGRSTVALDPGGQSIWLTVYYPDTVPGWEIGQRPPVNTVDLSTTDAIGTPHTGSPATTQSTPFGPTGGISVGATKTDSGAASAGYLNHFTQTAGSYLGPQGSPDADQLVLTDSGAAGSVNESWFDHADINQLYLTFSTGLAALGLPYTLEYQVEGASTWIVYTGATASTGRTDQPMILAVQNAGSLGWQAGGQDVLNLPAGSSLTGWRLTVAPGSETVPVGSEARLRMGFQPVFRGVAAGIAPIDAAAAVSPGPQQNTVTVDAADLTNSASSSYTPTDSVYITTRVDAPLAMSVGGSGVITAGIVNQNPSETYASSSMDVVLPCGIFYDPAQPITPLASTIGVPPAPTVGAGVAVDATGRVSDTEGCQLQVVRFGFDQLPPMRAPGTANDRSVENSGWRYAIPVTALAQAYDPADKSVSTTSWATSADPRFLSTADGGTAAATVPMVGYGPFFNQDAFDFDPARTSIGYSTDATTINTAGGLLIAKLSSSSPTGPWALDSTVGTDAYWQIFVQDILPNPVTGIRFFDELPSVADGDDFDTELSGAVTGAPAGATVEYSTDATDATTGTWTTDPADATAFRIVTDMVSGDAFTLVVPTTVQGGSFGETATNDVSAAGSYNGNPVAFTSNEASVNVQGSPSLAIVKKTDGVEYSAAPGATVGTDSTVTWTYTVTNTGDTPLDSVAISDAFTAGDGSTGTLTPTSSVTGVLLPGDSRTFTATGSAITGQYANTATATAVAVDDAAAPLAVQPAPVSDDSWYLAGDSGLSIVKTTNGQDVDSAPGLPLVPASDVDWAYAVTNTGALPLTDVLVEDVDAGGNVVFTDTIPTLAPGESATLTASGTAISGQYHNTVTATAADPTGGETPLTSADESWYFGLEPGLDIQKQVSAHADGPWTESTSVTSGAPSYWRIVVTNSGNAPLTDVVVTDDALGRSVTVGALAPGESRTIDLTRDSTTEAFTNVAVATGTALDGGSLTASDDADVSVVVEPAAGGGDTPAASGLAQTGLAVGGGIVGGSLLLAVGILAMIIRRRRDSSV